MLLGVPPMGLSWAADREELERDFFSKVLFCGVVLVVVDTDIPCGDYLAFLLVVFVTNYLELFKDKPDLVPAAFPNPPLLACP
jgi:hypothetical protein